MCTKEQSFPCEVPMKNKYVKPVEKNDKNVSEFAYIEAVQAKPIEIKVYDGNFEKAVRAFRTLVQRERILSTYKERQSYEKPSDRKRRKKNEAKRKLMELEYAKNNPDKSKNKVKKEKTVNNNSTPATNSNS